MCGPGASEQLWLQKHWARAAPTACTSSHLQEAHSCRAIQGQPSSLDVPCPSKVTVGIQRDLILRKGNHIPPLRFHPSETGYPASQARLPSLSPWFDLRRVSSGKQMYIHPFST